MTPAHAERRPALKAHLRWMIRRDMAEVLDIEQQSHDWPWGEEQFVCALRKRNGIGMVAEGGEGQARERVVGFYIYELHDRRIEVVNFAVHPAWRRRGVGRQMIQKLASKLAPQRRVRLDVDVRESNTPAQLFLRSSGFRCVELLRSHYDDSGEDAYHFQFRCGEAVSSGPEKTL